jgi:GNAT superfamily N-acetyltransferase
MFNVALSDTIADYEKIIELQRANHAAAVAPDLREMQGFVTMEYTVPQLQTMSGKYRHVVAKSGEAVVGYALVLLKDHKAAFPFLHDMFQKIEAGSNCGKPISEIAYFVMGQVCIEKDFRGKGIFKMLYRKLKEQMSADFDLVITEVSEKNKRSMRAHREVGFRNIQLEEEQASEWNVIGWDWATTEAACP